MKSIRLVTAGVVVVSSGVLTLSPLQAAADSAAASPVGTAQASTLQVSLAPSALLAELPDVAGAVHGVLSAALGGGELTARVGAARATGSLSTVASDLQQGHAESTPLEVDFAPLEQQLHSLQGLLDGAAGAMQGLQRPGGAGSVAGGSSALTGLLGNSILGTGLLQQLGDLPHTLTAVGALLDGIAAGGSLHPPQTRLADTVSARYRLAGLADVPTAQASLADLNLPSSSPLQLDLAPFHARAVTGALASANGISGPQSSADNRVNSLAITPQLSVPHGGAPLDILQGLLRGLLDGGTGLPAVQALLHGLVAAPAAEPLSTALLGLVGRGASPLGGRLAGSGLLGGILAGSSAPALGGLTGASTVSQAAPVLGAQDGGPAALVGGLTGKLTDLDALIGPASPLGALLTGRLGLNSLVRATDLASAAIVEPASGDAIRALASTKAADVQVLPLGDLLGGALARGVLGDPGTILGGRAALTPETALLDVKGITASAQAVLGPGAGSPVGTSSASEIDVLGVPVAGLDQLRAIPAGSQTSIAVPGTGLRLIVGRGLPSIGYDTTSRRSVSMAALNVRLVDDGTGALGALLAGALPSTGAPAGAADSTIAEVALGNAAAEVSAAPVVSSPALRVSAAQGPTSPSTGMFGPVWTVAAVAVAALALAVRAVPGLLGRRRRAVA